MKGKKSGMLPKVVSILVTFIQIIIGLDILLQVFGANETPFVKLINSLSEPILQPFAGIFQPVMIDGHTLDLSAVFALIVYSVIGFGIQKILSLLKLK
ncbi:YggT family protein [Sporolactobacillus sp. THM7-4]|nr:YggT family protein [Sporolactobacillus sp. THM7-4]